MGYPGPPFKKCRYCGHVASYFGRCPTCGDRGLRQSSPKSSSIPLPPYHSPTPDYSFVVPEPVYCDSCGELISGSDIHRLPFDDVKYDFSYCEYCCADVIKNVEPRIKRLEDDIKKPWINALDKNETKADRIRGIIGGEHFVRNSERKKMRKKKKQKENSQKLEKWLKRNECV